MVTEQKVEIPEVPEVEIPEGASPAGDTLGPGAGTFAGKSASYTKGGEVYYTPGSTMHDMGFRTQSEYIKAQRLSAPLGPHGGSEVDKHPGSLIVFEHGGETPGQPVGRYTKEQVEQPDQPGYSIRETITDESQVRVPVKDYKGKEKLLTYKQTEELTGAAPEKRYELARQYRLIPEDTTFEEFSKTPEQREREVQAYKAQQAAASFVDKDFRARNTELPDGQWIAKTELTRLKSESPEVYKILTTQGFDAADKYIQAYNTEAQKSNDAIAKIQPYTKDGKVNVLEFIRANRSTASQTLKDAGYDEKDIAEWQKNAANPLYINAIYQEQVRAVRNELLKTTKPMKLETGEQFVIRVDRLAQAEAYKNFSPEEQKAITKERFIQAEVIGGTIIGMAIGGLPGIALITATAAGETVAHWPYLSTKEKAVAVSIDVATLALMLWGGKVLSVGAKKLGLSSIGKTEKLATKAGKAGQELEKATTEYQKVLSTTKDLHINITALTSRANAVEKAQRASMKADRLFLEKLDRTRQLSAKELTKLEKASDIKGLKGAITDVSKASQNLDDAWKYAKRAKLYTEPRTKAQIEANIRFQMRMAEVQAAQRDLQIALEKADSTLKPRYSQEITQRESELLKLFGEYQAKPPGSRPPLTKDQIALLAEVKGSVGGIRRSARELKATLTQEEYEQYLRYLKTRLKIPQAKLKLNTDKVTLKAIDDLLSGKGGISPKKEAEIRQTLERLSRESRAKYEAEQAKAKTAVAEQRKATEVLLAKQKAPIPEVKPIIKTSDLPKVKPEPTKATPFRLPSEEYGRMTGAQIARYYEEEPLEAVRSRTIEEVLAKTKDFTTLTPREWQSVREQIQAGVEAQIKADTQGLTKAQANQATREAVEEKVSEQLMQAPQGGTQPQTRTDLVIKAVQKERLKLEETIITPPSKPTPPRTPPPAKPTPPRIPALPIPVTSKDDKEKRAMIAAAPEVIAWPQGELAGERAFHYVLGPYDKPRHIVLRGEPPPRVTIYHGPGEAYRHIVQVSGKGPQRPVPLEGGIADPTIELKDGRKVVIRFEHDKQAMRRAKYFNNKAVAQRRSIEREDIGSGVIEETINRKKVRHIKGNVV